MRPIWRLCATTVTALTLTTTAVTNGAARVEVGFHLMNVHSRKCLTVTGGAVTDNSIVIQKACGRDLSSLWRFRPVLLTGSVRIVNVRSGKCLTIAGGGVADNGLAVLHACDRDAARRWVLHRPAGVPRTAAVLENANSRKCLTIAGGGAGENGVAVQYACDDEQSRRWTVRPATAK